MIKHIIGVVIVVIINIFATTSVGECWTLNLGIGWMLGEECDWRALTIIIPISLRAVFSYLLLLLFTIAAAQHDECANIAKV